MAGTLESLRQAELFLGLSDDDLRLIEPFCREAHYPSGDVILRIGDPVDNFYLIRRGSVEILAKAAGGGGEPDAVSPVIVLLGEGQTFGEMGLVDRGARSATVRAQTDLDVYVMTLLKQLRFWRVQERN
jgi:CRP/FNR family transcriptional regulator, cyclic AMP receptor protein